MITSWWPDSLTIRAGTAQGSHNVNPQPMSTSAKVSQVSKFLCTLLWASLVYGARGQLTEPFAASMELSSLDGINGFFINRNDSLVGLIGSNMVVSSAGDFNGDGLDDVLIGIPRAIQSGSAYGNTYLIYGNPTANNGNFIEIERLKGLNGFILIGEANNDQCGFSVSSAGDVNGDGLSDIVIGAPGADPLGRSNAGKSYVVFGSRTVVSGGTLNLSSLNGSNGFILHGEAVDDQSGNSVSSAGDVNGDGIADLVVGAQYSGTLNRKRTGKSYVVFGRRSIVSGGTLELSSLNGSNGFILIGEAAGDLISNSVSSAGDVNGDGLSDLVIGAYVAKPSGKTDAGKSYVVFGSRIVVSGGILDLSSLNGTNGFVLYGENEYDRSGTSVSSAGDLNGDGLDDIVIGAVLADSSSRISSGKSYVVFGRRSLFSGKTLELSSLNGSNGFILNGEATGDRFGCSVSSAGDVNGDGISDIVIGAYGANPSGRRDAGKSYVVFGSRSVVSGGTFELSSLNGTNGFILKGEIEDDHSGFFVSSAGDVNGDRLADLVIGVTNDFTILSTSSGNKSYVVFGRNLTPSTESPSTSVETSSTLNSTNIASLPSSQYSGTIMTSSQKSYDTSFSTPVPLTSIRFLQSTHSDESISTKLSTVKSPKLLSSSTPSVLTQSLANESTPLIIGIAAAIGAFACSLLAGGLFVWRRKTTKNEDEDKTSLKNLESPHTYDSINLSLGMQKAGDDEMQSARYDQLQSKAQGQGIYTTVPTAKPQSNYKEWPQEAAPSDSKQYTSIDRVEKQHDAYAAAKMKKTHENYDDLSSKKNLNQYKQWPQQSVPSNPDHYTSIDKVEKQHDAYAAAKFEKAHENYDELPT